MRVCNSLYGSATWNSPPIWKSARWVAAWHQETGACTQGLVMHYLPGTAFRAGAGGRSGCDSPCPHGSSAMPRSVCRSAIPGDERDAAGAESRLIADRTISTAQSESRSSGLFVVPGLPPDDLMGLGFDVTRVAAFHENFERMPGRRPGHRVCFGQPAGRWQQRAERVSTIFDLSPQQFREPDVARGVVSLHGRGSHRASLSRSTSPGWRAEMGQEVSRCRVAGLRGPAGSRHVRLARRRWPGCEPGSGRAPGNPG